MLKPQLALLASHNNGVEKREVPEQDDGRDPRPCRNGNAERKYRASQIQRIPRVSVRTASGEHFLFPQVSSRDGSDDQPNKAQNRAETYTPRVWAGECQNCEGERIAQSNAPAG